MTPCIRHPVQYFLGDLAILADGARRFEDRQYRFERIAVDLRDALDILLPVQRIDGEAIAKGIPVLPGFVDLARRYQAIDWLQRARKPRILPHPARLVARERQREVEHIDLPARVEAAAILAPLEIPIPDRRKEKHGQAQPVERNAMALDLAVERRAQRAEEKSQMFELLRRGLLTPHALT
ncbi:hypothetical protein [Sphingopyxis fribergensis]